ncbi:tetratricopeptide repeat protein, partial [Zobellia laminariae]|uniref:tetratricopeptide repeat protein n=1 Tax=Zobellia laminariae TaxID=248906 RepID=UPI003EFA7892
MKISPIISTFFGGFLFISLATYAQETPEVAENQSAEVFLEDYSDDFQEKFFDALKQKGIENYDRAINLMLACKQLDANNYVVDHELAQLYLKEKQYPVAEPYALTALLAEPENLWYTNTYVEILQKQQKSVEGYKAQLPFNNAKFKENLALVYYRKGRAKAAQSILKETPKSSFTQQLSVKVE